MKETQIIRLIKALKKRKVYNYEFATKFHILSHSRRIKDIRERGYTVSMERVYDSDGKATGVFVYWIPRRKKGHKKPEQALEYEQTQQSNFLQNKLNRLKGVL